MQQLNKLFLSLDDATAGLIERLAETWQLSNSETVTRLVTIARRAESVHETMMDRKAPNDTQTSDAEWIWTGKS